MTTAATEKDDLKKRPDPGFGRRGWPLVVLVVAMLSLSGWSYLLIMVADMVPAMDMTRAGPGMGVFNPAAIIPLISALMFALYGLLTRYAARRDSTATSFFWTGIAGAVIMTAIGMWFWEPMEPADWGWMAMLCISGVTGHWLLIKCYEMAEASAVQPFAYFHLLWAAMLGIAIFGETLRDAVIIGTALIVGAGLFTLWRERAQSRS